MASDPDEPANDLAIRLGAMSAALRALIRIVHQSHPAAVEREIRENRLGLQAETDEDMRRLWRATLDLWGDDPATRD